MASAKRNCGHEAKRIDRETRTLTRTVAEHHKSTASKMTTELNQRFCDPLSMKAVHCKLYPNATKIF